MIVVKEFTFDAAHFLTNYKGKCERLHGHTYKLQVMVKGPVQENGMLMDFIELKKIVNKKVIDRLDHSNLNDTIEQSSAENISIWIWNELKDDLPHLHEIRVWETPTSFVIYNGEDSN